MATKKPNPSAVALGKLRAQKGPDLAAIGALGGKKRAKPTACERCGQMLPTAREAWMHCRKPRAKKTAATAKKATKKRKAT